MNYTKSLIIFLVLSFSSNIVISQTDTTTIDEDIKKGWTFGALPVVAYDSDIGFKYGGLINLYNYGKESTYPKYKHSIFAEWSRTTKGSGINQLRYDSEYLIPNTRVTFEASFFTEKALDFYGFNGAQSNYFSSFEDDSPNNTDYISRLYYRHGRKLTRIKLDFQRKLIKDNNKIRWIAGVAHYNVDIESIDIENLNSDLDASDKLPTINGLYDNYIDWGLIPNDQINGGIANIVKLGMVYDSRDKETNPAKGIWTEALIISSNKFLGSSNSFTKLSITHRQYFSLIKNKLNFAYRLSYQPTISGTIPFYMLPFVFNTDITMNGLGGSKTIRGVLRNRIVGQDFAYSNAEFRWKFFKTIVFKQNLYLALVPFVDFGLVTKNYEIDKANVPINELPNTNEELHYGYGAGLKIVLNQNFVVSVDYGLAGVKNDGSKGLYITIGYLF